MAITISFNQDTGSISVEDYNFKKIERHKGKSLLDFPKNYIVIDIETTGLDTSIDSIIEIGAIKVVNNSVESTFSSLVKPPALEFDPEFDDCDFLFNSTGQKYYYIDSYITNLTHITNEMLDSAPEPQSVLKEFLDFISNDILVGHNVNFDINFLYDSILKYFNRELHNDFVDTLRLSRRLHKDLTHHRLADMANYYQIDVPEAHRSLADCVTTNELFHRLQDSMIEKYGSSENLSLIHI